MWIGYFMLQEITKLLFRGRTAVWAETFIHLRSYSDEQLVVNFLVCQLKKSPWYKLQFISLAEKCVREIDPELTNIYRELPSGELPVNTTHRCSVLSFLLIFFTILSTKFPCSLLVTCSKYKKI